MASRASRVSRKLASNISPALTATIRTPQRREVGCPTCRSHYWESPAMADRHLPRRKQTSTPGLPRRICLPAQPPQDTGSRLSDPPWSRNRSGINRVRADPRSEGSQNTTHWGLLSQADKQKPASQAHATLSGALESRTDQPKDFIRRGGQPWDRAAPRGALASSWRGWPQPQAQLRKAKSSAGRKG